MRGFAPGYSIPAAIAYDAVQQANAQGKDLVLADTAGKMQSNINLMDEMKKINRGIKPDLIIFVGDASPETMLQNKRVNSMNPSVYTD